MKYSPDDKAWTTLLGACLLAACATTELGGSWQDKTSLSHWQPLGVANWRLEGEEIVADGGNGFLVSRESYEDVEVHLEFWVDATANSGVFLRAQDPQNIMDTNTYEVNIFDNRPDQTYRTGGVVHYAAPAQVIDTADQWNTFHIIQRGEELRVILNGVTTVQMRDDSYQEGPIALQYAGGIVRFRNVQVRAL